MVYYIQRQGEPLNQKTKNQEDRMKITKRALTIVADRDCAPGHSPHNPCWSIRDGNIYISSKISPKGKILCDYEPYGVTTTDVRNVKNALEAQ